MCRRHTLLHDSRGVIAILAALVLPIAVFLLAVLVDMGMAFVIRSRLQATAELATQAGAVTIGDLIVARAEANNPPPEATDPLLYLSDDDIRVIVSDTSVSASVQQYIAYNHQGIEGTPNVTIWYPNNTVYCDGTADQRRVDLRVHVRESFASLFPSLFLRTNSGYAEASAIQSVPICPP